MPKRVDHAARKRELADAAIEAIDGAGLDGVRLVDVAKAAKLTTGAVVHYLPSKDAVLAAALEEVVARLLKRLKSEPEDSVVDLALDYLPSDDASWRETRVWLQFWGRALSSAELRAQHRRHYADIVDAVRAGFPPGMSEAEEIAAADAIIAAVDGLSIRIAMEPDLWPEPRRRATLEVMLAAFLEPENAQ
jgi:AcrR family transcriptional regulator